MNEKYQLAVLGTGSGGSEAALLAAKKGYKVIVVENGALGGTRLHHGSYAVRALHASARLHGEFFKGKKSGIEEDLFTESLTQWMKAQRVASTRLGRKLQGAKAGCAFIKSFQNANHHGTCVYAGLWSAWPMDTTEFYFQNRVRANCGLQETRKRNGIFARQDS